MRRTALFALPIILALALAGCGKDKTSSSASNSSSSKSTTTVASAASSSSGDAMVVAKLTSSPYGEILTDAQGNTLYVFAKDTGTTSNCTSACAQIWPPMAVTGTPAGGTGINASDLGTTTRSDGTMQLTFFGHPVYHYAADSAAGDTSGQGVNGFGGIWHVVNKSGNPVTSASGSSTAPPTTKASSSGY